MGNEEVFAPIELWKKHHKRRREKLIYNILDPLDTEQRLIALKEISNDLSQHGLEVDERDWDPLEVFDGRWELQELTREQKG